MRGKQKAEPAPAPPPAAIFAPKPARISAPRIAELEQEVRDLKAKLAVAEEVSLSRASAINGLRLQLAVTAARASEVQKAPPPSPIGPAPGRTTRLLIVRSDGGFMMWDADGCDDSQIDADPTFVIAVAPTAPDLAAKIAAWAEAPGAPEYPA